MGRSEARTDVAHKENVADSLGIFVESGTLFLGGAGNDATITARRGLFSVVGTISSLYFQLFFYVQFVISNVFQLVYNPSKFQ